MNLVISGSQQNGIEENLIRPIAEKLYEIIKADDLINVVLAPLFEGNDEAALYQAIQWSNQFCIDAGDTSGNYSYHFAIHADAGAYATGASGLYYSDNGKAFITSILSEISAITPWDDVGLRKRIDLGELKNTIAIAGLIELSFYDNSTELEWMQNNIDLIVGTLKKGIYTALNLSKPVEPVEDWQARYNDLLNGYYGMRQEVIDLQKDVNQKIETILNKHL
jgi:N-acetylmuramoyl-L-alanine amidase